MERNELLYSILSEIKRKADLQPPGTAIRYRAGEEGFVSASTSEQISALNLLEDEGVISITGNFGSDYE
jgi:hypothetical protein